MADIKITRERMLTFNGHERVSTFKAAAKLEEFGERQNEANELLAIHITELIRRVCVLEEKQSQTTEILRRIVTELSGAKKELDRVRLTEKLNSGAIERLDNAIRIAQGGLDEETAADEAAEEEKIDQQSEENSEDV